MITLGIFSWNIHFPLNQSKHYSHLINQNNTSIEGKITERIKPTLKTEKFILSCNQYNQKKCSGKILLTILKSDTIGLPKPGDHVLLYGKIQNLSAIAIPEQFNYAEYLQNKAVFHQIFISDNKIKIIHSQKQNLIQKHDNWINSFTESLKKSSFNDTEINILKALFLGQRQDMDKQITQQYVDTGVIHILAISGMHIGIIMLFLGFILSPIDFFKNGKTIKTILILIGLWYYAWLTGLSGSVVRAVTQFSFIAIAIYSNRTYNMYNVLFASLFTILIFNPQFLFDIGFQLSYVAVFSIVWFHPILKKYGYPKNRIGQYLYNLITISLVVQIGLLPLCLYYFHQFPALFLISNLLMIPLVTVLMFIGIPLMAILYFKPITLVAFPIQWIINSMNKIAETLANQQEYIFKNISFTFAMLIVGYGIIISLFLFIQHKKAASLLFCLSSVIVFQLIFLHEKSKSKTETIITHQYKNSLILNTQQNHLTCYHNHPDNDKINQTIASYTTNRFIKKTNHHPLQNVLFANNSKILVIDSSAVFPKVNTDIILLTQSAKINLERLISVTQPKQIIADGSNYPSTIKFWKSTCLKYKIPFHITSEMGFYSID